MNTVKKGNLFESKAYHIINSAIAEKRLGLDSNCCKIYQKPAYFSKDRGSDIIFDISIEVWPPNADRCHLLYLIECKDYKGSVPVNDIEEFIYKIQQVAGHYVKGVFITTGDVQQGGLNLLRNKNMMLIKVDAENIPDIVLFNKPRKNEPIQRDLPVAKIKDELKKLVEIRKLYEHGTEEIKNWDVIIERFLQSELSAKVNWEQPGEHSQGLEFLSKTLITELSLTILNNFNPAIASRGHALPLECFMSYLKDTYNLRFITNKRFVKKKSHLNGYYDRRKRTIYINPELEGTGQYAFVCAHEISHFFLHENLEVSQEKYDGQSDSKYDPITQKYLFEKEKHWIEWQANYLASCLLMPHRSLLWQLIKWQTAEGISRKGYIWLDNQACNIRDFKVAITQLAFIFGVSRTIIEFRMADLGIIQYKKARGYNAYSLFGEGRRPKTLEQLLNQWKQDYQKNTKQSESDDLF